MRWRGPFSNAEVNALHAAAFAHPVEDVDWWSQVRRHSLGWVCARAGSRDDLIGFVNVGWDGGGHAFLLDTMVAAEHRGRGVGTGLVAAAAAGARFAGCQWLHVDFEPHLRRFYLDACGFQSTDAGLIAL